MALSKSTVPTLLRVQFLPASAKVPHLMVTLLPGATLLTLEDPIRTQCAAAARMVFIHSIFGSFTSATQANSWYMCFASE
jgi:hypothetical protein